MSATNQAPPSDPALAGESNVPRILGLGITFHALALVAFTMRMYTRIFIVKSFGKDDVMMILCMVSQTRATVPCAHCRHRTRKLTIIDLVAGRPHGRRNGYGCNSNSTRPGSPCFHAIRPGPNHLRQNRIHSSDIHHRNQPLPPQALGGFLSAQAERPDEHLVDEGYLGLDW